MTGLDPRNAPLVLIPQHFGSLVFDRSCSRYMPFDGAATDLLTALAARPLGDVLDGLQGKQKRTDQAAAIAFFEAFERRGFFAPDTRFAGAILPVHDIPANHLLGPLAVHLEVIGACNLACSHCFAGTLPRNQNPLRLSEMKTLFDDMLAMGAFRLGLTGGEPLMRKDFVEIVDAALDRGLHPCLTTNGFYITDDIARQLGQREMAWINVSLDGATPATNDAIRGAGSFEQAVAGIRTLARHARFTLAFTITSGNHHEAEACAQLAHDLGAHTAVFRPLYPTGTALQNLELMPTYAQYADALERLEHLDLGTRTEIGAIDPFSPQARKDKQATVYSNDGCGAGNLVCSISVQGDVSPCSFLGTAFEGGNIRRDSLRDIWNMSQIFTDIRDPNCGSQCDDFEGGCRARALSAAGSAYAADPWHEAYLNRERDRHPQDIVGVEIAP